MNTRIGKFGIAFVLLLLTLFVCGNAMSGQKKSALTEEQIDEKINALQIKENKTAEEYLSLARLCLKMAGPQPCNDNTTYEFEAIANYKKYSEMGGENPEAYYEYAQICLSCQFDSVNHKIIKVLKLGIERDPNNAAWYHCELGNHYMVLGKSLELIIPEYELCLKGKKEKKDRNYVTSRLTRLYLSIADNNNSDIYRKKGRDLFDKLMKENIESEYANQELLELISNLLRNNNYDEVIRVWEMYGDELNETKKSDWTFLAHKRYAIALFNINENNKSINQLKALMKHADSKYSEGNLSLWIAKNYKALNNHKERQHWAKDSLKIFKEHKKNEKLRDFTKRSLEKKIREAKSLSQ